MSKAGDFFDPTSAGYTGYLTYTKGDNSSFTYGVQNELVVGSAYEAALGGATTIAMPLNSCELKNLFTNLEHRTNVTIHRNYVEMDAELPSTENQSCTTEVKSFLKRDSQCVSLQKLNIKENKTLLSASDITQAATELTAHYEEQADAAAKPTRGSQLRPTSKAVVLATGEIGSSYKPGQTCNPSGKEIKYLQKKKAKDIAPAWGVITGDVQASTTGALPANKNNGILLKGTADGDGYLQLSNNSAQMAVTAEGQLKLTDKESTFGFNLNSTAPEKPLNSIRFTNDGILITFQGVQKSVLSINGSGIDMGDVKIVNT